jgi:protease YdgD
MKALLLAGLLLATSASAHEGQRVQRGPPLPGIGADDPRRPANLRLAPWDALGRVQTELGGRCTGVMVAPDRVLTAAHCLIAPRSRNFVQPGSVHFLLGYDRGRWTAQARVREFITGEGYGADGPIAADWALLTLERRIVEPRRVLPLLRTLPPPRTPVMLGGYQQDRPEVLMADADCRIIGAQRAADGRPVMVHDCAGTRGASGAPLLAQLPDGGGWAVAGVLAAVNAEMALGYAVPAAVLPRVD